MRSYVYGTCVLAGLLMSGAVYAEPIKINPYPDTESVSEVDMAPVDSASPVSIEESAPKISLSGFRVPQPGDAYFDPPSQDDLRPVVEAQPMAAVIVEAEEPVLQLSEDLQDKGFVQRAITTETFYGDKPAEPIDAQAFLGEQDVSASAPIMEAQEEQPLVVRMSETIDDWAVDPDGAVQAAAVIEPVHEAEMPVVAAQEAPVETVSKAPESIAWNGPRVPVHTPMVSEAVEPASGDAMVEDVIEPVQSAGPSWRALEGQNIRQTLELWSQDEDAEILWENQHAFAVLKPFEIRGSYEQAVQKLLDQYQSSEVRPVATLHVNPQNQRKTLVVRVVEGG